MLRSQLGGVPHRACVALSMEQWWQKIHRFSVEHILLVCGLVGKKGRRALTHQLDSSMLSTTKKRYIRPVWSSRKHGCPYEPDIMSMMCTIILARQSKWNEEEDAFSQHPCNLRVAFCRASLILILTGNIQEKQPPEETATEFAEKPCPLSSVQCRKYKPCW